MLSVSFCFRLSEAFNSTIQTKKLKIQTCILNTAENLFDRCGENKKYFRHIFRLMKKIEFYFTLFTSRSKFFLSILTSGWQSRWYEQRHLGQVQTPYLTWAESNANEQNPLFSLICIRLGSCEVRRLNRALVCKQLGAFFTTEFYRERQNFLFG